MISSFRRHPLLALWLLLIAASQLFRPAPVLPDFQPGTASDTSQTAVVIVPGIAATAEVAKIWYGTHPNAFLFDLAALEQPASLFLHPKPFHLVAYGSAAPAAVRRACTDSLVASLTLVGPAFLEEYLWMGDFRFNRAVYTSLKAAVFLTDWLIPHFGFLPVNRWETHLNRLLRANPENYVTLASSLQKPVLLVHHAKDVFAPVSGAYALDLLLPNNQLVVADSSLSHFLKSGDVSWSASLIRNFHTSVENATFSPSSPVLNNMPEFRPYGLGVVLIFVAIILATFVTEDITCFLAGVLVASGTVSFAFATAACVTGLVLGDFGLYMLGRLGRKILHKAPFKYFIPENALQKGRNWVTKHGARVIFLSRFTPGMRTITYVSAGILKAPALAFLGYFLLAALLWTPLLVGLSMVVGLQLVPYFKYLEDNWFWLLPAVWFFLYLIRSWLFPLFTWKGRRLLLSKVRRMYMWEFWPAWLYNIPTVIHVFIQGLRYRKLSLFSACNPGIPHSGFVGESKVQILTAIKDTSAVARFEAIPFTLPVEQQMALFRGFMQRHAFSFPIVLKPDVGQRGAGVTIVRSEEQARRFFEEARENSIVQEYIAGAEFGVFYIRLPWEEKGFIWSLTEKKFTHVVGDGVSNLETLILRDNRTVCIAAGMLKKFEDRLDEIIPAGEKFYLTEIGNHFRGALFLDGHRLKTEALRNRIDEIAKSFDGFYYGRFDIRCPDADALANGRDLKVIELNGVTSEPTHIYQPGYSLLKSYYYVLGGWTYAFKIGKWNVEHGATVTPLRTLLSHWFTYLKTPAR